MSLSPPSKHSLPLLPIFLLVIAMISIQSGASLAKSLFPLVGAQRDNVVTTWHRHADSVYYL